LATNNIFLSRDYLEILAISAQNVRHFIGMFLNEELVGDRRTENAQRQ
jgi:hypothetical protein